MMHSNFEMDDDDYANLKFVANLISHPDRSEFDEWYMYNVEIMPEYVLWIMTTIEEVASLALIDHIVDSNMADLDESIMEIERIMKL